MNQVFSDLAAGVSAYLQELRGRDIPYELAAQLVRDWHTAQLQAHTSAAVFGMIETFDGQHVRLNRPSSPSAQPLNKTSR